MTCIHFILSTCIITISFVIVISISFCTSISIVSVAFESRFLSIPRNNSTISQRVVVNDIIEIHIISITPIFLYCKSHIVLSVVHYVASIPAWSRFCQVFLPAFLHLFCVFSRQERFLCPFPHNEGPVYHMATGFVKFFGRFWSLRGSQEVCFGLIFSVAASGRAFFSLGPEALSKRQRANLYPCSLYLILYLPLRDLSGVLWVVVGNSKRKNNDLECRIRVNLPLYLFILYSLCLWFLGCIGGNHQLFTVSILLIF